MNFNARIKPLCVIEIASFNKLISNSDLCMRKREITGAILLKLWAGYRVLSSLVSHKLE